MLSVGRRDDGGKGVGLGLGFGGRGGGGMEEYQLEEGEACFGQEDDPCIDPDVSFSYIDEKLHDVLGHFQKEFEAESYAENLGSKYGGYGSFLPAYQRSPSIRPQPRSPPKALGKNVSLSPSNSLENRAIPVCASISRVNKSSNGSSPRNSDKNMFTNGGGSKLHNESGIKSVNCTEHKPLKLRLKLGSAGITARSNAAIYIGLGLNNSPSSSPEDSPYGSDDLFLEHEDKPDETPMTTIEIMTCFPAPGGCVLSPLPDSLLLLTQNGSPYLDKCRRGMLPKGTPDKLSISADMTLLNAHTGKRINCGKKDKRSTEGLNIDNKLAVDAILKKENSIETQEGQDVVTYASNTSKISMSSSRDEREERQIAGDSEKWTNATNECDSTWASNKTSLVGRMSSPVQVKKGQTELTERKDDNDISISINGATITKGNTMSVTGFVRKALEERRASNRDSSASDLPEEGRHNADEIRNTVRKDFSRFQGRIDIAVGPAEPFKQKSAEKASSFADHLFSGQTKSKRKPKNSMSSVKVSKGNPKAPSSVPSRDKKKAPCVGVDLAEDKSKLLKLREEPIKGQSKKSRGNIQDIKPELPDSKTIFKQENKTKYLKIENKEAAKLPSVTSLVCNAPTVDAIAASSDPVVIKENWVGCDKCQQWRLLPYGTNPDHLPKKWHCKMLNWLPGMNSCHISEEETTKALHALYQVPLLENGLGMNAHNDIAASSVTSLNGHLFDRNLEAMRQSIPNTRKKKHALRDPLKTACHSESSIKSTSLIDVNHFALETDKSDGIDSQFRSKSVEFSAENKCLEKGKHKDLGHFYDEGELIEQGIGGLKSESKRVANQEGSRTSKKIKLGALTEGSHLDYEASGKAIGSMAYDLSVEVFAKNAIKKKKCNSEFHHPAANKLSKGQPQVCSKGEFKDHIHVLGTDEKSIKTQADAKCKVLEWQEYQGHQETPAKCHRLGAEMVNAKKESAISAARREKTSKALKPGVKQSGTSKPVGMMDQKRRITKIRISAFRKLPGEGIEEEHGLVARNEQHLEQHQFSASCQAQEVVGDLKEMVCAQPATASALCSPKVFVSNKDKANFQEVSGSPVESVSSSPLRASRTENLASRGSSKGKDDVLNDDSVGQKNCLGAGLSGEAYPFGTEEEITFTEQGYLDATAVSDSGLEYLGVACDHTNKLADRLSCEKYKGKSYSEPYVGTNEIIFSAKSEEIYMTSGTVTKLDQHRMFFDEQADRDHFATGSMGQKSNKSALCFRDSNRTSKFDADKGELKFTDSVGKQEEIYPRKSTSNAQYEAVVDPHCLFTYQEMEDEKSYFGKNEFKADCSSHVMLEKKGGSVSSSHSKGHMDFHSVGEVPLNRIRKLGLNENLEKIPPRGGRLLDHLNSDKSDQPQMASSRTPWSFLPLRETHSRDPQPASTRKDSKPSDAVNDEILKVAKQRRKTDTDKQKADHLGTLVQPMFSELDARSPVRNNCHSSVGSVLKEARDLKHKANRLKNEGLELESTGLYFQAALKFLHVASLWEPSGAESTKHGETDQSVHMYSDTARLCQFCAHEYERRNEMAAAALAYKCVEVAYLKVAYLKHPLASKDRHELQTALQLIPPGDSPSSSASDIDNLINQGASDKTASAKGASSPQIGSSHTTALRKHSNFTRWLDYTNETIFALEASRKSRSAFAAVTASLGKDQNAGVSSVGEVLDLCFHNVNKLLRLVRLSMESIGQ